MMLDEILTAYEDLWRKAALNDTAQGFGRMCGGRPTVEPGERGSDGRLTTCAWLIHPKSATAQFTKASWTCPLDGCEGFLAHSFHHVLVHLNNAHHWTWDMLANKTRDVLQQGGVRL